MKFQLEDFFYGLHYLWGIETNQFHDRCLLSVKTFWITLPMRDWDETFIKTVCIADTMDYITYERLRHFRCEGKCWVYWKMGLHYLWGIETEDFWSSNPLPSIGLHYLWGIETNLSRLICPCGDINGLHYLWGIETIKFLLSLDSVKLSRDYITYEGLRLPEFHLEQRKYKFVQLRITLPMRDWDTTAAAYLTRSFE